MCNKFTYINKFTNNMDALLVGGGLATGGWLLNAKQENERNKGVSNKSPDVFIVFKITSLSNAGLMSDNKLRTLFA